MLKLAIIFTIVGFVAPSVVLAKPPRADIRAAAKLARKAKRNARKGVWGEAARLYSQAEELNQIWEYPFALAKGHRENGLLPLAWRAVQRAAKYGVPDRKRAMVDALQQEIEAELLEDHAFIELVGVPENAEVRLNGRQWLPPYEKWVDRSFSHLVIEHPKFVRLELNWHHLKGKLHSKKVLMASKATWGHYRVVGTPEGATVIVDGHEKGRMPTQESPLVKPGTYPVRVEMAPDYRAFEGEVVVKPGETTELTVSLEPTLSDFEKLLRTEAFWGWTLTGLGGAMTITGATLLGLGGSRQGDLEDLNATHTGGYADYEQQYNQLESDRSAFVTSGHVLFWLGLAAAGTGATLLVLDHNQPGGADAAAADRGPTWQVFPAPGGAGAVVRF